MARKPFLGDELAQGKQEAGLIVPNIFGGQLSREEQQLVQRINE
jgi:hypothetical protein